MKHLSFCLALPLLVVVSFASMLDPLPSRGQSKNGGKLFAEAAKRNALLSTSLIWTFGSKQQTGWYLYTPLIKQLIGTKQESATVQFAQAVARWQAKSALKSSGVIDEETLYAMIKTWQDARLKDRTQALPDQLLTAPLSDFYDPTRAEELRQVERRTYAAYKRLVSAAIADRSLALAHQGGQLAAGEKYLKIISAFRSREYQEKLRREAPNSGSAGLAVNSPHFTGRALDLYVGGEPVDTRDSNRALQVQTRVYQWLVRNAGRFGFRPYCYEPWHWEFVK
ncbi:MAG: zinc D-Ala-D-Ala carboxypeptidase [Blastocatellia bacterium]|jgi:LAS superfamily LD-carboxypeptidase LdcB|nr:zinc D-Ala-D-Ala carboxypeptidase [Blastocatellia bacterium]